MPHTRRAGEHLAAIQASGLHLVTPDEDILATVPAFEISAITPPLSSDDVVVMATKAQAAESALVELAAAAAGEGQQPAIVCCTNGISVERTALRHFERVYGVMVEMPGTHLTPGTTFCHRGFPHGFLPVGRYPDQPPDELCERIGADFAAAGLVGGAVSDIMQLKNRKCAANPSQLTPRPPLLTSAQLQASRQPGQRLGGAVRRGNGDPGGGRGATADLGGGGGLFPRGGARDHEPGEIRRAAA